MGTLILHFEDLLRKIMPGFYKLGKNEVRSIRKMVVDIQDVPKQISISKQD